MPCGGSRTNTTNWYPIVSDIRGAAWATGIDFLKNNRIGLKVAAEPTLRPLTQLLETDDRTPLQMLFEAMPFESESIDLVVMPHALEVSEDPHALLREVYRILIPGGRVILTGFNLMSLWGLRF